MKIEILDIAELELDDAFEYYEDMYKGLGKRFIEEFESTLHRVMVNPMAWQNLANLPIDVYLTDSHIQ